MGHLSRNTMLFQRKSAGFGDPSATCFCNICDLCQSDLAAGRPSILSDVDSLDYCPFPGRYVPFGPISVTLFMDTAKYRTAGFVRLAFLFDIADFMTSRTLHKGRKSCLKLLISSLQQRFSVSQLASTQTASARLLALALAALLAKQSVATAALKARLLAALSAHLLTTSKVKRLTNSIKTPKIAAAGQPCARRFCF